MVQLLDHLVSSGGQRRVLQSELPDVMRPVAQYFSQGLELLLGVAHVLQLEEQGPCISPAAVRVDACHCSC